MKVRKAVLKDVLKLKYLDKLANKEIRKWGIQSGKEFKNKIKNGKFYMLVAELNNQLVAYIESEYDKNKKIIWIKNIYVIKDFMGQKIGKNLIDKTLKYWKKKIKLFVLFTADRNIKIFEKMGFKKTMNYMIRTEK